MKINYERMCESLGKAKCRYRTRKKDLADYEQWLANSELKLQAHLSNPPSGLQKFFGSADRYFNDTSKELIEGVAEKKRYVAQALESLEEAEIDLIEEQSNESTLACRAIKDVIGAAKSQDIAIDLTFDVIEKSGGVKMEFVHEFVSTMSKTPFVVHSFFFEDESRLSIEIERNTDVYLFPFSKENDRGYVAAEARKLHGVSYI